MNKRDVARLNQIRREIEALVVEAVEIANPDMPIQPATTWFERAHTDLDNALFHMIDE
jgi:hypothetical protein